MGNFFVFFFLPVDFFQNLLIILSRIPSECQTVWIQIRPNILSGLIGVQTVCKCYQQMTLVGKELTLSDIAIDTGHFFATEKFEHLNQ